MFQNFMEMEGTHNFRANLARHTLSYLGIVIIFSVAKVLEFKSGESWSNYGEDDHQKKKENRSNEDAGERRKSDGKKKKFYYGGKKVKQN
mmetsp:Transcript_5206/g.8051  ORF Transcript_5206/g.8051 Transcript_5206/m.8051 type:complete len:90 (+) Transcript_5206:1216-1485(+)